MILDDFHPMDFRAEWQQSAVEQSLRFGCDWDVLLWCLMGI